MDVKNTKEVLIAANEIALFIVERLKDGIGVDDAVALYTKIISDEDFKAKVVAAYDEIAKVPAEVKDIDIYEGVELITLQTSYVPKIIDALKK